MQEVYCRDGRIIWISEDVRAVKDAHGNLLFYEGIVRDITARKQAEVEGLRDFFEFPATGHSQSERFFTSAWRVTAWWGQKGRSQFCLSAHDPLRVSSRWQPSKRRS